MRIVPAVRRGLASFWCNDRGVVMAMVLVLMSILMGMGATAIYSGYTNLQTATNLKLATRARMQAETNINEALYRLSLQETDASAIVSDLTDPTWQVQIDFSSGDTDASDGYVSTVQASTEWPNNVPTEPVIIRYKRLDPAGAPNNVLFYDPRDTDSDGVLYEELSLPAASIPDSWHPVYQVLATAQDERGAERQIMAEATETVMFAPPSPLASGVDVNLNGSAFIDGVNHNHLILLNPGSGANDKWGDVAGETTTQHAKEDSPDDHKWDQSTGPGPKPCGAGGGANTHDVANPNLNLAPYTAAPYSYVAYTSCPRLFNDTINTGSTTPAWLGVTWDSATNTWSGINTDYVSPIALSNGPTVTNDPALVNGAQTKGIFTWHANNGAGMGAIPGYPSTCDLTNPTLVCRPSVLWHSADSFSASSHFPFFQEFLNLDDASYLALLDRPDVCGGPLATCGNVLSATQAPEKFTYIEMNNLADEYVWDGTIASPTTDKFGLIYVKGSLRLNANSNFKGVIFVDGSLTVVGSPVILGALMVRGATNVTAGAGSMTLLWSKKAAELGIQAGRPWRIISWAEEAVTN